MRRRPPMSCGARFTQSGYYVYSVKPRGLLGGEGRKRKVKLESFLVFNQQFVTLIKAGLPILGSIDLLARRQKNLNFPRAAGGCGDAGEDGRVDLVGVRGARRFSGRLYDDAAGGASARAISKRCYSGLWDFQRVSLTFRKKLTASLIYPSLLIVMVIGLLIFLITFVVPQFAGLYEQLGSTLPGPTVFLLAAGKNAQSYGLYVGAALALVVYLVFRWTKTDRGASVVDRIRIATPILGGIWLKYQVGLFSRTLSTLLTGGLPLVPSLETSARAIDSRQIGERGVPVGGDGARGQGAVGEPAGDEDVSGAGDRDDRGGREHGARCRRC